MKYRIKTVNPTDSYCAIDWSGVEFEDKQDHESAVTLYPTPETTRLAFDKYMDVFASEHEPRELVWQYSKSKPALFQMVWGEYTFFKEGLELEEVDSE